MISNNSPWIAQLKRTRPVVSIGEHLSTDVIVVGGGIAGVVTSYFLLKHTHKKVILLEADKIAHGATGHNAGQVTSYFERPLYDIAEEFGIKMAVDGQQAIESAWTLLDEIILNCSLTTPLYRFIGFAGYARLEQLLPELKSNLVRVQGGLPREEVFVSRESGLAKEIPSQYKGLYTVVRQQEILEKLETHNTDYIACMAQQKGCTNSAMFTEELVAYLALNFKDRFNFYEGSRVKQVTLTKGSGIVEVEQYRIAARHIVLCTNGFENFHIKNEAGQEIETIFHHTVRGRIGYMAGYVEESQHPPIALSFYPKVADFTFDPTGDPYFYLTRRPYEHNKREQRLVCIGGPERALPNDATYSRENPVLDEIRSQDEDFLQKNYRPYPPAPVEYSFLWHGLMGYTPNKLRRIGFEPLNTVLLYNLGCNGVGILPSIYGGKRISQLLSGLKLDVSIFDPQDQRKLKTILSVFFRFFKNHFRRVR